MALGKVDDKTFQLEETAEKRVYHFFDGQGKPIYTDFEFIAANYLIKVYKGDTLLAVVEPADNTILMCNAADEAMVKLANDVFGAKRFVKLPEKDVAQYYEGMPGSNAVSFLRDREFPLGSSISLQEGMLTDCEFYVGPEAIQTLITNKIANKEDKTDSVAAFYSRFNQFFEDKSGFTEEKIANEYKEGASDTFVRFNNADSDQVCIVMADKDNTVLGCIRGTIFGDAVYICDEIAQSDEFLTCLFHKLQTVVNEKYPQVKTAYIRAASGKEQQYDAMLGCTQTNLVVIHGPATTLLKAIAQSQRNAVAKKQLNTEANLPSLSSCAQPTLYGSSGKGGNDAAKEGTEVTPDSQFGAATLS